MTPQQLTKNPSRPIIKVKPYQKLDIDEGQSVKDEGESIMIQFPPKMDENWLRYELLNGGQISRTKLAEDAVLCVHNTASALNR